MTDSTTHSLKKVNIFLPEITPNKVKHIYSKSVSYRKGGHRLEHEVVKGKHIFHNYGLGGAAALSLAFGTAYMSSKSLFIYFDLAN